MKQLENYFWWLEMEDVPWFFMSIAWGLILLIVFLLAPEIFLNFLETSFLSFLLGTGGALIAWGLGRRPELPGLLGGAAAAAFNIALNEDPVLASFPLIIAAFTAGTGIWICRLTARLLDEQATGSKTKVPPAPVAPETTTELSPERKKVLAVGLRKSDLPPPAIPVLPGHEKFGVPRKSR